MRNALKGALLSVLVFPGLGQVALRCYRRGAAIMITVLICLSVAVVVATRHALAILEQLAAEGGAISMSAISDAAVRASSAGGSLLLQVALLMAVLCWIIAGVDAYVIGKRRDVEEREAHRAVPGDEQ